MKKAWTRFFCTIPVISLLTFATVSAFGESPPLKYLTLNFNAETTDGPLEAARFSNIEKAFTDNNYDFAFFQEAWTYPDDKPFSVKMASDLGLDQVYHFEDGISGIRVTGISLVAKKSLQLRNTQAFKLPHSATSIGDGVSSWAGLGEIDMLIGAEITLPDGRPAFIWTAHLNSASDSNRLDQIKFAYQKMQDAVSAAGLSWASTVVMFAGDFNSSPSSPQMQFLRENGFDDEWLAAHPDAPGLTLVGDITNPEYDPMVHGAGMFPSQAGPEETDRIDYSYVHSPGSPGVAVTRMFTSPVKRAWTSDHFGLSTTLDFSGAAVTPNPENDSPVPQGPPTVFTMDEKFLDNLPSNRDFSVPSERGFTVVNVPNVNMQFFFTNNQSAVYSSSLAGLGQSEIGSFAFLNAGDYKYRMIIRDYRPDPDSPPDYSQDPVTTEMDGTLHVQ